MTALCDGVGPVAPEDVVIPDVATRLKATKAQIDEDGVRQKWDIAKRLINP